MSNNTMPTMLTYIKETPKQLQCNLEQRKDLTKPLVNLYLKGEYKNIWIIASGSSYNASQCARDFIMKYLDVDVKIVAPTSFILSDNKLSKSDLAIVISQSGCSTNAIDALKKLKTLNRPTIGITGNLDSDFKDHASTLIDYGVGIEKVSYVTKGVVALVFFLIIFALEAAHKNNSINPDTYNKILLELSEVNNHHAYIQEETVKFYSSHKYELTSMTTTINCGFMQGYGIALEAALKMGETIKIPNLAFEAEEFLHGPSIQLTPKYTIFLIDDFSYGSERIIDIYKATRSITKQTFLITNNSNLKDDPNILFVPFNIYEPLLSPLYILPFFQIISYLVTEDLNGWKRHPLFQSFDESIKTKTDKIKLYYVYQ